MHRPGRLPLAEGRIGHGINVFDIRIGQRIASCRDTVAMDHQGVTRAPIGLVIGIDQQNPL